MARFFAIDGFYRATRLHHCMKLAFCLATASLVSGCLTFYHVDVVSQHQPREQWAGLSYRFQPRPELEADPHFSSYQDLVRAELTQLGMVEAAADHQPDLSVAMDYRSVITGRSIRRHDIRETVQTGYRTIQRQRQEANGDLVTTVEQEPIYREQVVGHETRVHFDYQHKFHVVFREPRSGAVNTWPIVFEGTGFKTSSGQVNEAAAQHHTAPTGKLHEGMPFFIRAVFRDFPGPKRGTRLVKVMHDKDRHSMPAPYWEDLTEARRLAGK